MNSASISDDALFPSPAELSSLFIKPFTGFLGWISQHPSTFFFAVVLFGWFTGFFYEVSLFSQFNINPFLFFRYDDFLLGWLRNMRSLLSGALSLIEVLYVLSGFFGVFLLFGHANIYLKFVPKRWYYLYHCSGSKKKGLIYFYVIVFFLIAGVGVRFTNDDWLNSIELSSTFLAMSLGALCAMLGVVSYVFPSGSLDKKFAAVQSYAVLSFIILIYFLALYLHISILALESAKTITSSESPTYLVSYQIGENSHDLQNVSIMASSSGYLFFFCANDESVRIVTRENINYLVREVNKLEKQEEGPNLEKGSGSM